MLPGNADLPEPARNQPEPKPPTVPLRHPVVQGPSAADLAPSSLRVPRPPLPTGIPTGPDFRTLLKALGRRWLLAATLGCFGAVAAAAGAWYLLGAKYTVYAQMRVAAVAPRMLFKTADMAEGSFTTYQKTAAAAIRSRFVLNAALKKEEVKRLTIVARQADPIIWLEDEIKVESKDGSELLTVIMTGEEPEEMVVLIDAVTKSYLTEIVNEERKARSDRVAELDDIYTKSKDKLRIKRETLRKRADELGTSDSQALTQKQVILMTNFGDVRRQHGQIQFDLMRAQAKLAAYKARTKQGPTDAEIESTVTEVLQEDPKIKGLTARIPQLQKLVAEYERSAVLKNETSLLRAHAQLEIAKKDLESRKAELRGNLAERMRQRAKVDYENALVQLQDEVNLLQEQDKTLQRELQQMARETEKIGNSSTELEMLKTEIKREEDVYEKVANELEALQVELRSPPRVSLYQEAAVQKRDLKRQLAGTILAPLLALIGVCFCVAWLESRARRIHTADEVSRGLGIRVVGAVPVMPDVVQVSMAVDDADADGQSHLESIDAIRTLLLRDASLERTRVVMVTSAVDGEGKTTLASHLAGSLARAGRRTLLVDCDLRGPAVHPLFDLPMQPGFSEALLGEIGLDDVIQETPIDGLWIVAAGQWDREVIQALAKEGVEAIFERLKEQFDFVIVDSHPVLDAADSLLIGQHVDAVLLSLLRDVSQVPRVYAAGQRLTNLGIRVLGAVVNGMGQEDLYGNGYQLTAQTVG